MSPRLGISRTQTVLLANYLNSRGLRDPLPLVLHPFLVAFLDDHMEWAGGVYPEPPSAPSYRDALAMLDQYEGVAARLRAFVGGALFVMAVALPPGLLALGVFVVHGHLASYAVGISSLCAGWLPAWAWKHRLWERFVRRRLAWRAAFDPRVATVSVRLADRDSSDALWAIRHAGLTYQYTRMSAADGHSVTIGVAQWAFAVRRDDSAFRDHVCEVFRAARISANVGGIEVGQSDDTDRLNHLTDAEDTARADPDEKHGGDPSI